MPFPKTDTELTKAGYKFKNTGVCKAQSCKAVIEWWETPKGKVIPLDSGSLEPHWATCKEAKSFRGGND